MAGLVEEGTGASGRLRQFLRLPVFADEEQMQKAQALHFVIWSILLVINSQFYVALFILPRQWARWVAILLTIDFTLPLLLLLNRRRGARAAGILLLVVLWLLATIVALLSGGIHAPVILAYVINMLIAGLLFGGRGSVIAGITLALSVLGFVLLSMAGLLSKSGAIYTAVSIWVSLTLFFELIAVFQILSNYSNKASLNQARQVQALLRRSHDELETRVQERTAELQKVNKELEAFSYSVSHDLRRPLRTVIGFSDLLMEDHGHELSPEARELMATIRDSAVQMNELIESLLQFSRIDRQALVFRRVDLTELVRKVIAELQVEQPGRRIEFRVSELPECMGDPALLRQVFVNLLSNAVKFTRTRPVAVIEVGFKTEGTETIYFVRDNGVGFNMQHASRLFGVFQRLHSTEDFPGTGAGLSIVQRIMQRHGGRIWAESAVDQGATFYFTLPQPNPRPEPPEKADVSTSSR